jgi:hypothetical protein
VNVVHQIGEEFADLVEIVSAERGLRRSIVEKDYWVTHALWALSVGGFEVWFKGGTSLSKGFGLIDRFSEDLDLKIEPGVVSTLPAVSNWKSEGRSATAERRAFFEALSNAVIVPDCSVLLDVDASAPAWRGASFRVSYPSLYPGELPPEVSSHVLLEVGSARVTPFLPRDLTSWVHDRLDASGFSSEFTDNRPRGVRCIHPMVTLLEKLDALQRRFPNEQVPAPTFVRHYEDAARLVAAARTWQVIDGYADVRELANEMLDQRQLSALPTADDRSVAPGDDVRWTAIRAAHTAIEPMFWGPRVTIDEACKLIRDWVATTLG